MRPLRPLLQALTLGLAPASAQAADPPPIPVPQPLLGPFRGYSALTTFTVAVNVLEQWLGPEIPDLAVHSAYLSYLGRRPRFDARGEPVLDERGDQEADLVPMSGRVFYPPTWRLPLRRDLPLVVYPHFTGLGKKAVPSAYGGHEWVFAAAAALYYGFAVAMPDLPGMGADGVHYHPFCHATSLAWSTLDAIPAALDLFRTDPWLVAGGYGWDGRTFLLGYSEGAYTSLAAARELATRPEAYAGQRWTLTGAACMSGPFDLSDQARRDLIRPDARFTYCFFLPYLLTAWAHVYGPRVDLREAFAPVLLEEREDGGILRWMDGTLDGFEAGDYIARRLGKPQDQVRVRDLLNPAWMARELEDPAFATSGMRRLLEENDLHQGWRPTCPILFCHSPADADLSYQQSLRTAERLGAELALAGSNPADFLRVQPIGDRGAGWSHLGAIAVALPAGFEWIHRGMPMDPGVSPGAPR
ncbi:alpha/beta hydrolase [Mesoterricola sediminis]|uniref:Secretory lipase n=1 Tax=Mesoterricola sediminis TaxID=2927980 RepID=A0AA48KFH7_9BACT|nr:hypothetical protein [Mesoterricola sediminis]BDU78322.1 hypothetical protein METESE_32800 [Mesoterricola sediminis]